MQWENHNQSLRLESDARAKIQKQIEEKVNNNDGTWIDWQYLLKAGELLAQVSLAYRNERHILSNLKFLLMVIERFYSTLQQPHKT